MTSEDAERKNDEVAADEERSAKRIKLDTTTEESVTPTQPMEVEPVEPSTSKPEDDKRVSGNLPPSRSLLGELPKPRESGSPFFEEFDVGISEYISKGLPPIHAIIKQRSVLQFNQLVPLRLLINSRRFTDFLVREVNLDREVVRIKSLAKPSSESKKNAESTEREAATSSAAAVKDSAIPAESDIQVAAAQIEDENVPWPERFNTILKDFVSEPVIEELKKMFLEGPEPPFVSDSGWSGRPTKDEGSSAAEVTEEPEAKAEASDSRGKRGKRGRDRGRGRGRGGGAGKREDTRKVLSDVSLSVFSSCTGPYMRTQ